MKRIQRRVKIMQKIGTPLNDLLVGDFVAFGEDLDVLQSVRDQVLRLVVLGREGQVDDQVQVGLPFLQQLQGPRVLEVVGVAGGRIRVAVANATEDTLKGHLNEVNYNSFKQNLFKHIIYILYIIFLYIITLFVYYIICLLICIINYTYLSIYLNKTFITF
jgi:hypothetical protein